MQISNAEDGDEFKIGTFKAGKQRVCGRVFNVLSDDELGKSICSKMISWSRSIFREIELNFISAQTTPFRLTFNTDSNEVTDSDMANENEQDMHPGGIVGFNLSWRQVEC